MKADAVPTLIKALQNPSLYDHTVKRFQVIQTHISWVLLTGPYAYKIKKPLNLGFLDFSSLENRHFYCMEELRLNKRLAPQLYLDVVAITGSPDSPAFHKPGPAIEYAVRMKEFPQDAQLDRVLARGELRREAIDSLAQELAEFHQRIGVAGEDSPFGSPDQIAKPVQENFEPIRKQITGRKERIRLKKLQDWTKRTHRAHGPDFQARKRGGFIRECHGDMHLANMVLLEGQVVIFDCLEFNENLRWIDVMSETAFLTMDLDDRGYPAWGHRILNDYLEKTGDYAGLRLLRYYQVYRALVRAKVACIRMNQAGLSDRDRKQIRQLYRTYADLAERYTRPTGGWLAITHGLSGSGKTMIAQSLVEATGAVCVRTDVERKRLHGLSPMTQTASGTDTGLYSPEATRLTYQRMAERAGTVLRAGFPVIVDGAFLKSAQRQTLRATAEQMKLPFIILDVHAPEAVLRQRILERARQGRDVSEATLAVLEHQIATREPLDADERARALEIETEPSVRIDRAVAALKKRIQPS